MRVDSQGPSGKLSVDQREAALLDPELICTQHRISIVIDVQKIAARDPCNLVEVNPGRRSRHLCKTVGIKRHGRRLRRHLHNLETWHYEKTGRCKSLRG